MSEQTTVTANQQVMEEFLLELIEEMNTRHASLEKRIEQTLSTVANSASDMRRIQMVGIDSALAGFRGLVIQHCLGKGE